MFCMLLLKLIQTCLIRTNNFHNAIGKPMDSSKSSTSVNRERFNDFVQEFCEKGIKALTLSCFLIHLCIHPKIILIPNQGP
jgi:hypothetical protein